MTINPVHNHSLSSAVPTNTANASVVLLGKQGENAESSSFATIEAVSLSARSGQATVAPQQHVYKRPHAEPNAQQADEALQQLKQRDQEVRTHEQAHAAVAGVHSRGVSYRYETGPDGARYAVSGEVAIDLREVQGDPQATLDKMNQIQRAAMAPAEPSAQDRQVALQAGKIAAQALQELAAERQFQQAKDLQAYQQRAERAQQALQDSDPVNKPADKAEEESDRPTAAERFAEQNDKTRRVSEVLLGLSAAAPVSPGQILADRI